MKFHTLAFVVFLLSTIFTLTIGIPSNYSVLQEINRGLPYDLTLVVLLGGLSLIIFGSCIFSGITLFRDPDKIGMKTIVALYALLGITLSTTALYGILIYIGSKY